MIIWNYYRDFSGGPEIKSPPCSAGDAGWIPGQRTKVPHAMEQISPHVALVRFLCAITTEGRTEQLLSPCAWYALKYMNERLRKHKCGKMLTIFCMFVILNKIIPHLESCTKKIQNVWGKMMHEDVHHSIIYNSKKI